MTKIRTSDEVLDVRTKAAIGKYMKQIRAQIVKEAQAQGHHIKDQNIKSVTYQGLSDVSYEFSDLDLGDFVITDWESLLRRFTFEVRHHPDRMGSRWGENTIS